MKSLEDDAYSFGYILLEAIVGASVSARREAFLLNDLVIDQLLALDAKLSSSPSMFHIFLNSVALLACVTM